MRRRTLNRVTRCAASRREFIGEGLPAQRVARVVGRADQKALVPGDPISPRNRRITIVLRRADKEGRAAAMSP